MRKFLTFIALAAVMLAGVSPAGAFDPGEQHWRKGNQTGTNRQYLVYVHYDTDVGFGSSLDPSIRDNYTAQFSSELNQAIAKLDAHPDLRVVRETSSSIPCHDNFPNPIGEGDNRNCVEFYRVSSQWLEDRAGIPNVIGLASWWQNPDHIWNDSGSNDPALQENTWFAIYHGLAGGDPTVLDNVFCHELAHTFDLDHPTDGTPGPCDGSGNLDAGDLDDLDKTYCTTHVDGQPAPRGSTLTGSDTSSHQECVGALTTFGVEGELVPPQHVQVADTLENIEGS